MLRVCQERVGNGWDGSIDLVDKLGYVKFDDDVPDDAVHTCLVLFRVRSAQPDAVPLLMLRATTLLNPVIPIMVVFEPHDVAPGEVATPLQGGSGSWGFLSPADLAGKFHSMVHPVSIERLTYRWIGLAACRICAVEDVTTSVLLCRARAPRDVANDLTRTFSHVRKPATAAQRGGRRKRVRKDGKGEEADGGDDDDGHGDDGLDPGECRTDVCMMPIMLLTFKCVSVALCCIVLHEARCMSNREVAFVQNEFSSCGIYAWRAWLNNLGMVSGLEMLIRVCFQDEKRQSG